MLAILVICHEKVLRLAAIDCSSPMSAKIERNTGSLASAAGTNNPACAINAVRPAVFSATVLPPVLGPVIRSTVVGGITTMSTGTGSFDGASPRSRRPSSSRRAMTPGISSGWRARPQLQSAVWRQRAGATPDDELSETHLRLNDVELGRRIDRLAELDWLASGTASVRCRKMRCTSSRSCCSSATISLLISTVLSGSRYRLAPLPEAAVDDSGNRGAMLGLHDENIAAVAVADHLILQILRRILAPQIRLERRAEARSLLAQVRAQSRQFGARLVVHFAGWIDLAAHLGDLVLERPAVFSERFERGEGAVHAANRGARQRDRVEKLRKREQPDRLQRPPFHGERGQHGLEIFRGMQRKG